MAFHIVKTLHFKLAWKCISNLFIMAFQAGVSILPFRLAFQFGNQHWHFNLAVQLDIWNWHYQLALQIGISIWHFLRPLKTSRVTQNRKNQCLKTSSDIPGDLRLPSAFLCSNFGKSSDFCGDLKQPRVIFCNLRTSYYQIGLLTTQVARSPRQFFDTSAIFGQLRSPRHFFDTSGGGTTSTWWGNRPAHFGGTARPVPGEPLGRAWWTHTL